jgi:hypothetical protein
LVLKWLIQLFDCIAHTSTAGGIDALIAIVAVYQSNFCSTNTDLSCRRRVVVVLKTAVSVLDKTVDIDDGVASRMDVFRLPGRVVGVSVDMVELGLSRRREPNNAKASFTSEYVV